MPRVMPELGQTETKMLNTYAAKISIYNMLCRLSETIILNMTFFFSLTNFKSSLSTTLKKIKQIRISASFSRLMK